MTERARMISAFITPSGLFEWLRMPFGLKNAPQIYQSLIDNALYGYLKIGDDTRMVATDTPDSKDMCTESQKLVDVFIDGEPDTSQSSSVLGRRSYIDDILILAISWDTLYFKVERLLEVCDKWNLSISLAKSFWGRRKVDYLGHQISLAGLEAYPKDLESLVNIPFPKTLRSMQSFLGSLNYYSRFIEDFAIYASVLYELREADFHEICRLSSEDVAIPAVKCDHKYQRQEKNRGCYKSGGDQELRPDLGSDQELCPDLGGDLDPKDRTRWEKAVIAFTMLKDKIAKTPILKHFDPDRIPVIVVYASKWAVSAALLQEHDGVYWPVTFSSRTLKPNEVNYGMVEKEVLALLGCWTFVILCWSHARSLFSRDIQR